MSGKEKLQVPAESQQSEVASAEKWLQEIDQKIEERINYLAHVGRKLAQTSPEVHTQLFRELTGWKNERKEVEGLLKQAKEKTL